VRRSARRAIAALACAAALVTVAAAGGAAVGTSPPPSGADLAALSQPPVYAPIASQRIYFVMLDRYANGDPSNDRGGRAGGPNVTGYDPTDSGYYHGGDLKGLTGDCADPARGLARIRDLGFNAIWVTPPFGQVTVQGSSAAYHGYWIRDFTSVDPHLGQNDDFAAFVACAHRLGLKVILDVVVNHTGDVILVGGGYVGPEQLPYRDCHGRPFVPSRYAGGKTFPCMSAKYMPRVPVVLPADRHAKKPDWLNTVTRYHDRGDISFDSCNETCFEQGDFYGLDDLFTEQPAVVAGLAQIYAGWITRYKLDGFRIDTAKHVDAAFFGAWVPKILAAARSAGVPDFQLFGEVTLNSAPDLATFVRDRGLPNVLDFPLQDSLVRFAGGSAGSKGIANRLADDDYFRGPNGLAVTPATFLGNHDMGRAALMIRNQSGATGDELVQRDLLGQSLLYLLRGAPVVTYGDEVGMIGAGGDKAAREDMFPTRVPEWQTEDRVGSPPIGTGSSFDVTPNPVAARLKLLGKLRDENPALSTGSTLVRVGQGSTLVVSRIDRTARREYVAAFNSGTGAVTVTVPTSTPSVTWEPLLGATAPVTSGADGRLGLTIPPLTALLFRANGDLPQRTAPKAALRVQPDLLSNYFQVSATAQTADPLSVTFAVRRAGGKAWRRLATDDSPPYRGFLDPSAFHAGEHLELVALVRASDGSLTTSPVVPFVVRRR